MAQVDHYGLHWAGPVGWLLQGRKGSNFIGFRDECPFEPPRTVCNHLIPAAAPVPDRVHWAQFLELLLDPLVQAMLPVPGGPTTRAFYLPDPHDELVLHLTCLSRLSSPIKPVVWPVSMLGTKGAIEREMQSTNVQPLVITQMSLGDQGLIDLIAKTSAYAPRTVILTGLPDMVARVPMKRLTTEIAQVDLRQLMVLPLENIGAAVLRKHSRKEAIQ